MKARLRNKISDYKDHFTPPKRTLFTIPTNFTIISQLFTCLDANCCCCCTDEDEEVGDAADDVELVRPAGPMPRAGPPPLPPDCIQFFEQSNLIQMHNKDKNVQNP